MGHGLVSMGGISRVFPGIDQRREISMLIKPNLLKGARWDKAVTTHPSILESILILLLSYRSDISFTIADSPGFGSGVTAARLSGYQHLSDDYPVVFRDIRTHKNLKDLRPSASLTVARGLPVWSEIDRYDYIINCAKAKTHGQMGLTLSVKNVFGLVPGTHKVTQHYRAGTSRRHFARMLLELCAAISPQLHIVDGILAMEGNGPGSGTPRWTGFLGMSQDPLALDFAVSSLLGYPVSRQPVLQAAAEEGYDFQTVPGRTSGSPAANPVRDFIPSRPRSLMQILDPLPPFLNRFIRRILTDKPVIDARSCNLCGVCASHCPARVMTVRQKSGAKYIHIKYDSCIRCYCCQELCPPGAIRITRGLFSRRP